MKRKLILLIGCFLLLLLAFGTYRLLLPSAASDWRVSVRTKPTWGRTDTDSPSVASTKNVTFYDRSEEGMLRGVYEADSWKKQDDGSFTLENPHAEIYLPDGKRVYMAAEQGRVWAQEVAKGFNVRNGIMAGNVEIFFDQSTALERLHPNERRLKDWDAYQNEVMRIRTRNIEFNRDMLEIYTPNRVTVWSKEVDLVGSDLRIQWNESPRELRSLKLAVVDVMIIKQLPEPMDPLPIGEGEGANSQTSARDIPVRKTACLVSRPEGSEVFSRGWSAAEPPVEDHDNVSPEGTKVQRTGKATAAPAGLVIGDATFRGLTPPAKYYRPVGAESENGYLATTYGMRKAEGRIGEASPSGSHSRLTRRWRPGDAPITLAYYPPSGITVYQDSGETSIEDAWDLPETPSTDQPATQPAATETPDAPVETPATQPAEQPAAAPKTTQKAKPVRNRNQQAAAKPIVARNIYRATCNENVRVFAANRSVVGADEVSWTFEWTGGWRGDDDDDDAKPAPATQPTDDDTVTPAAETQPATQPTTQAATQPATESSTQPTTAPAEPVEQVGNRMEIYCDGPLIIKPIGATDEPSRKRYQLAGKGERVVIRNDEARMLCKTFEYANASRTARVRGDKTTPARLVLNRGDEIVCRDEIELIGDKNKAYLRGPGTMNRFAEETTENAWESILAGQADQREIVDQIFWLGNVEISFDEQQVRDAKGRVVTAADGEPKTRMYIKDATFHKNVQLARRVTNEDPNAAADFDYVKCDTLKVTMAVAPDGSTYPSQADAAGNVQARQEGSNILAQNATVWFTPDEKAADTEQADTATEAGDTNSADSGALAGMGGARVKATQLIASGGVQIKDQPVGKPARFIQAERINADLATRKAALFGTADKPARIEEGPNKVSGREIHFRQVPADDGAAAGPDAKQAMAPTANVVGAGQLEFFTDQGMGGEELTQPRHMRIKWTESMTYDGKAGEAHIVGGVELDSGNDEMRANEMALYFKPETPQAADADKKAAGDAEDAPSNPLAMGIDNYSSRDIDRIVITGGSNDAGQAELKQTTFDPAMPQVMLQRIELRGEQVIYTAPDKSLSKDKQTSTVEVVGGGRFSHEDYRPPTDEQRRRKDDELSLTRPSQTAFVWGRSMLLDQSTNHIALRGAVNMVHRSGDQVLKIKGLQTPVWKKLPDGRISKIRCDELDAWFAEAKKTDAKPAAGTEVMDSAAAMGPLKTFKAVKDVTLTDGPVTVDAQRVTYNAVEKIVNVWGYLEGQRKADARLSRVDPATSRTQTTSSPEMHWIMPKDGRPEKIVTGRISSGGGM